MKVVDRFKSDVDGEYRKVINLTCKKLNNNIANRFSYTISGHYDRFHISVIDESLYTEVLSYKIWIYISFDTNVIDNLIFKISKDHEILHSHEYNAMSNSIIRMLHFYNKSIIKCELKKK